jgi:hypothetical protein
MKKAVFLFSISLFIFSCEKNNPLIVEYNDIPLLSKVIYDDEIFLEYSYNDANLVIEEKSKFHYTSHIYNDMNQLTKSDFYYDMSMASSDSRVLEAAMNRKEWVNPGNTAKSITHTLEYNNNGQLIRKALIRPSASSSDHNEFTYENGRITRQVMFRQNIMSGYFIYEYDEKGNLIKESKYNGSSTGSSFLSTTTEYEYDSMINPYLTFNRLIIPGKYTNPNNITKETYTLHFDVDQWTQKVQITKNTYEYNNNGYPVKVNGAVYVYK